MKSASSFDKIVMKTSIIYCMCTVTILLGQPDAFKYVVTNTGGVVQGTPRFNATMASPDDWIGAFDPQGNCVGAAQLVNVADDVLFGVAASNFVLFGDDLTTSDIDEGMNINENFTLKLWDASRDAILVQVDSAGKPLTHSGWSSTNFTPINGYNDPYAIFNFSFNTDPVIVECSVTELNEDGSYEFRLGDFKYSDNDSISNDNMELIVMTGDHYTVNGSFLMPDGDYFGLIKASFQLDDGFSSSTVFNTDINILAVNDPPVIVKQDSTISVNEGSSIVIEPVFYTIVDIDSEAPFEIKILSLSGENYTFSGDTLFPGSSFFGELTVPIKPDDGQEEGLGAVFLSKVQVIEVNDPPQVTSVAIAPSIISATDTLSLSYDVSDPEGSPDTTVYISWYKNDVLVTEMNQSRKILPTMLFCDDSWFAKVYASDGVVSSDTVSSNLVTICKINTPPSWQDVPLIELTLLEDSEPVLFSMAGFITDEEQALSQLTLESDSVDVSGLIGASFVDGHFLSLSTLVENYFTPADSVIHISVWADDGYNGFDTTRLNITIDPVNDVPEITGIPSPVVLKDSLYVFNINSVDYSDPDNDDCSLIIKDGDYYTLLGDTIQPGLSYTGTLNVPFSISDGELSANDTLHITVAEDISSLTPFDLVYPFNDTTIVLTRNNFLDTLYFAWNQSLDPDGDKVDYRRELTGDLPEFIGIVPTGEYSNSNMYKVPYHHIEHFMHEAEVEIISGTWTIIATNGDVDVYAQNGPFTLTIDGSQLNVNDSDPIPETFALHANYPNPFNPSTTISYDLPERAQVTLDIYDILGKQIKTLVNQSQDAGNNIAVWDGTDEFGRPVSAGVYLYRIKAGEFIQTRKMLLLK